MSRRTTELLLLCLAAPIVLLLFASILMHDGLALSVESLAVPIGLFAAFVVAHVAVRIFAKNADPAILPIAFALSGIGIAFVTRLAPDLAIRQVVWLFASIICMVVVLAAVRNLDRLIRYKYTLMLVGIILLISPMLPGIGMEVLGSRIWLHIGSFSFQPGEIAKICIILFLAGYLAQNREMLSVFTVRVGRFRIPDLATLLPLLLMFAISFLIVVFEKDLGSALVCYVLFLVMLYVASGRKLYLVVGFGLAGIGAVALYMLFGHVQIRVNTWLDPFSDAQNTGYQLCQSIYSMADGGMLGVGVGNGLAQYIPVVESDFIFAAIAEEIGLLGGAAVLLLYLSLAIRGFATAARAKSDVSALVAVGCTTVIVLQAFIIVGGVTRLIPLTGLTLPFISQGGSSLLATFIEIALLLRCGDEGTGLTSEMTDGTRAMKPIGSHASLADDSGVLGRVALGKRLTACMVAFALLFAALVANLTYVMIVKADDYQSYPGNNHTLYTEAKTERGSISTYDGVVLAQSVRQDDGTYVREYPQGSMASHVVGYYSQQYGLSGIEASMNDALKGQSNYATWQDVVDSMAGIESPGNDVTLTLNSEIQTLAEQQLEGYAGAIVVMDPSTGAILACASAPTYSNDQIDAILAGEGSDGALVNRATGALYAPGSTFKVVSLVAAIENDVADGDTLIESPAEVEIGNASVTNLHDYDYGQITLAEALAVSSNTAFAQLGVDVGAENLVATSEAFGFNRVLNGFELPLTTSLMPDPDEMTTWETAWAAVGQPVGEHESPAGPQATVLQMAMVASAIANDGVLQQPYFVEGVYNADGERSYAATPRSLGTIMSKSTAEEMTDIMIGVVEDGTGTDAAVYGTTVAGKTGTAETGKENPDSWFIGFAPADNPTVVVAVLIEEGVNYSTDDMAGLASARASVIIERTLELEGVL